MTAPSIVDSIKAAGSSGTVSGSGLVATGSNRYVFATVGAGTSDAVNDIDLDITGASGTAAMTRVYFSGTNNATPFLAFEAFAGFTIDEAGLASIGAGPYSFSGTATGINTPDKLGLVAASVQDAPTAPTVITSRTVSVSGTPSAADTLVGATHGNSTYTSSASLTGATVLEYLDYGDGLHLSSTTHGTTEITVETDVNGRAVSALFLFAPASATTELTASLFSDADAFFAPSVAATYTLTAALYSDGDTLFAPAVTASVTLSPALFSDGDALYSATVAPGVVTLTAALFSDGDTLYGPSVASVATLSPGLLTDGDTFFAATVTQAAATQDLTAPLFVDGDTFHAATVTAGAVTISPSLVSDADVFFAPTVAGNVVLLPPLVGGAAPVTVARFNRALSPFLQRFAA